MLQVVIRVKVEILVRVRRFAIDGNFGTTIVVDMDAGVQERKFTLDV